MYTGGESGPDDASSEVIPREIGPIPAEEDDPRIDPLAILGTVPIR
jgi:hypothetical protein